MRSPLISRRIIAALAAMALTVAACGADTQSSPSAADSAAPSAGQSQGGASGSSGSITIALGAEPTTLDPQLSEDGFMQAVTWNIYETLIQRDQNMELAPGLAESWTQIDDTTWEFQLRPDVTFHNGEPFNADAAVASIERQIDPDFNSDLIGLFATIGGAEAVDDLTLHVTTTAPDPILPSRMHLLTMVPPEASASDDFAQNPSGTGPYEFVEWAAGQQITLTANADYWGGAPAIGDVTFRPIPEVATALSALQNGEVDIVPGLAPEQVDQAPAVEITPGLEVPHIRLRAPGGILDDVRVRQAMNYAIDKEALIESLLGGHATVSPSQLLTETAVGFNPDLEPYPYDPDLARELIADAGAEGLAFEIVGPSGRWLKDRETIEAIAGMLTDVGLSPTVDVQGDFGTYLEALNPEGDTTAIYIAVDNILFDGDRTYTNNLSCGGRSSFYCNEEVTELANQARVETDPDAREALYQQASEIVAEEAPAIFLFSLSNIYGLTDRVTWAPRQDGQILVNTMTVDS